MRKEKQIEEMAKAIDQAKYDMWVGKAHQSGDFTNHSKNIAKHLYNAGYRKQEWISVEERLPYAGEDVLVLCDGLICIDFICSSGVWYEHALKQVTHWMPLPEAPNMQREVRV